MRFFWALQGSLLCLLLCLLFSSMPLHHPPPIPPTFGKHLFPFLELCWTVPTGGLFFSCHSNLLTANKITALFCGYLYYTLFQVVLQNCFHPRFFLNALLNFHTMLHSPLSFFTSPFHEFSKVRKLGCRKKFLSQ